MLLLVLVIDWRSGLIEGNIWNVQSARKYKHLIVCAHSNSYNIFLVGKAKLW